METLGTISVVIPLYNKALHIARAVDSVLAQSVQEFEIVIVDDGSTDDGATVVRGMTDPRIRLFHQPNSGPSAARNRGIKEARAELIAFLDADDAWEPLFLETIARLRRAFPKAGAYATAYRMRDPGGREHTNGHPSITKGPSEGIVPDYFGASTLIPLISSSTVAVPRAVFAAVGSFAVGETRGEDLDMWLRIALKYPIAFSSYIGATWFRDSTNRLCDSAAIPADPLIFTTISQAISDAAADPALSKRLRDYHDALAASFAKSSLLEGNPRTARHLLGRCFSRRPEARTLRLLAMLPGFLLRPIFKIRRRLLGLPDPSSTRR